MERAFAHSFADVRIHDDPRGSAVAEAAGAAAVTIGRDIAFARGRRASETIGGRALLAHELAHVAQTDPTRETADGPWHADTALERDADRSAAAALTSAMAGVATPSRRAPAGIRLSTCRNEPLQSRQSLLAQGTAAEQRVTSNLSTAMADRVQQLDPSQTDQVTALARGEIAVVGDVAVGVNRLQTELEHGLDDAGGEEDRQRRAQERYLTGLRRMEESAVRQAELTAKYGFDFVSGSYSDYRSTPDERSTPHPSFWSVAELDTIDAILSRVPDVYMTAARGRIRKMERGGAGAGAAAAWNERTSTITIYDEGFERPDQLAEFLLHEIGHSTYQQTDQVVGGQTFEHLPPTAWMVLSDWQMSTSATLPADLGISAAEAGELEERLGVSTTGNSTTVRTTNRFRPELVSGRAVTNDRYQGNLSAGTVQYWHYDADKNDEFVSNYARTHPGEDLAETFAHFMLDPDGVRRISRRKHEYMETHYQHRLAPGPSRC